jgi:hypothetical protein
MPPLADAIFASPFSPATLISAMTLMPLSLPLLPLMIFRRH